jgi:hypothetical protein
MISHFAGNTRVSAPATVFLPAFPREATKGHVSFIIAYFPTFLKAEVYINLQKL